MNDNAIGIDIGGSFIKAGVVSSTGQILHEAKIEKTPPEGTAVVTVVRRLLDEMIKRSTGMLFPIQAIGISTCGVVDSPRQTVLESVAISKYNGIVWAEQLHDLNYALIVENDARAAAWAEFQIYKNQGVTNFIHVTAGTGIGSGIVLNGKIFYGSTYSACEIGHITVNANGPICTCGNVGCLELYSSAQTIVQYVSDRTGDEHTGNVFRAGNWDVHELNIKTISEAEQRGDLVAHEAFKEAGTYLGIGFTTLTNLFNPAVISVGGGLIEASPTILKTAQAVVHARALRSARKSLIIEKGKLGNQAGFIGAALLALGKA